MNGWFDSHCHVQEEFLSGEGEGKGQSDLSDILERASEANVSRFVCIGTGLTTSRQAVALARSVRRDATSDLEAWAAVGLHPHDATDGVGDVAQFLSESLVVGDGVVVAVGECGLDYFYEHSPRDVQRSAFAAQIALAHQHGLALVIHSRDAWDDLFDILEAEGVPERTVLHCFTGGPDEADRCLELGMFVSFSGIVTFKNADDVRAAAARCPLDRLLVETDSPFLAPVPYRGRVNEPAYLPFVGATVAEVKGCTVETVMESSAAAAAHAFSVFS